MASDIKYATIPVFEGADQALQIPTVIRDVAAQTFPGRIHDELYCQQRGTLFHLS